MDRLLRLALAAAVGISTAAVTVSCTRSDADARATTAAPPAAGVVDSALPIDELTRRFEAGVDPVAALDSGAARSRDELVTRFIAALSTRDTAALRAMSLSRAEFAYLYFPSTIYVRAPYATDPAVVWQLMSARSDAGLRRATARVGGAQLRLVNYACAEKPTAEGENRFWRDCTLRYQRGSAPVEERRLFGSIIERGGRWKLVSFANDF